MGLVKGERRSDPADGEPSGGVGGVPAEVSGGRRRSNRRRGAASVAVAALLVLVLLVGVSAAQRSRPAVAGSPLAQERIDTGFPGAVRIEDITVASAQRPSDDPALAAVLTDLNIYWAQAMPAQFGVSMTPLRGGYQSVDPDASQFTGFSHPLCINFPAQIAGNAYYCPGVDGLMFDSGGLVPVLLGHYGVAGLIASFGHEFGHVIQVRVGPLPDGQAPDPRRYPSLILEEAADCYSGAFLQWVITGASPHLHLPRSALVRAIAPLLDFRDPVGMAADDPIAHGLALDRLRAVLQGLRAGPKTCRAMAVGSMTQTLGQPGLSTAATVPRFASEASALAAANLSLATFVKSAPASPARLRAATGSHPSTTDLQHARPFGQFAVAAAQAMATGRLVTGSDTYAACFTGAWTASVFGKAPIAALGSWAGDADEALDFLRSRPEATIEQLAAYTDGFSGGLRACH